MKKFITCMTALLLVLLLSGRGIVAEAVIYLPVVLGIQLMLVLGVNLITASVTVYWRDLEHMMGVIGMAWMYLTPVVYSIDLIPLQWRQLYLLNPMAPLILAYRSILYDGVPPAPALLLRGFLMAAVILPMGAFLFGRLQKRFAEVL